MKIKSFNKLVFSILVCQLAGIIGSVFTISSIENWYILLNKPFFSPPNWIFGPVWTILYTLMGISLYLVWTSKKGSNATDKAYTVFTAQLILNTIWSIIFFGLRNPFLALIVIYIMLLAIILTLIQFRKISILSAKLLVPYLVWVSFASLLNLAIVVLN
ncbi:tryptophan-rich sensory protein [Candidatus Woesebacteria bacterium]|nr:MAG: tryptophan-rich sensory protein [Candidatus Woesebacteria bacterium]